MADVVFSGPFFDPGADSILADGITAARHAVADRGVEMVGESFDEHIRVNRGRFTSTLFTTDESTTVTANPNGRKSYSMAVDVPDGTTVVSTTQAAYGPWLAGAGSRNPVTRFAGYPAWQEAADTLDADAADIAAEALTPYIDKLNG